MKRSNQNTERYPDARLKGMRALFELMKVEKDWRPDIVNAATLSTLGVAPSKESNVVSALKFLGILDDAGRPSNEFDSLRTDFEGSLARLVKRSYSRLFKTIPTNRMTQQTLVKFFMQNGYAEDTAEYQGMLFVGLCNDSGLRLPNVEESFKRSRFKKLKERQKSKIDN